MRSHIRFTLYCLIGILALAACARNAQSRIDPYDQRTLAEIGKPSTALLTAANANYQGGDYEEAARNYIAYLKAVPSDANALYNLACCYGLLGREDLAAQVLVQAYKAGFEDVEHIMKDPDFDPVRKGERFIAATDSINAWSERKQKAAGEVRYYSIQSYLPYRIYLPENYDPRREYPLLVGLHGFGDKAINFGYLYTAIKDKELIMIVPEAPFVIPFNKETGYSWSPLENRDHPIWEPSYTQLESAILKLVREVKSEHRTGKTLLMGFSQGCAYTYLIGLNNPGAFDALLAFGGWLETEVLTDDILAAAKDTSVFIVHGTSDRVIGFNAAEAAYARLTDLHYDVVLHSF
ncbi:MAG: alpha/beta hydrolase-fold protein, partial [Candidatus Cloacimonadaceae bacterium]|nr:alpha/beta hydrolase-fold protein [Candidatus Cloacimonadaceae bacterium]